MSIAISIVALIISVTVAYLTHGKPARLQASGPRAFMAARSEVAVLLRVPLSLWNDGARALIVFNLRLIVGVGTTNEREFVFVRTVQRLKADSGELATQFVIGAREKTVRYCDFELRPPNMHFAPGALPARLDAKVEDADAWAQIVSFDLHISEGDASRANGSMEAAIDNEAWRSPFGIDFGSFGIKE